MEFNPEKFMNNLEQNTSCCPVFDKVAIKIMKVCQDPETSLDRVVKIFLQDAGISATVIKIANTPIYGPFPVKTLERAILRLGLREAMEIGVLAAERNRFKTSDKELKKRFEALWYHNFLVATLSKWILNRLQKEAKPQVFLAGLLHDFGKLYTLSYINSIRATLPKGFDHWLEENHEEIGQKALALQRAPKLFQEVSGSHHKKDYKPYETLLIIRFVDAIVREDEDEGLLEADQLGISFDIRDEFKMKVEDLVSLTF